MEDIRNKIEKIVKEYVGTYTYEWDKDEHTGKDIISRITLSFDWIDKDTYSINGKQILNTVDGYYPNGSIKYYFGFSHNIVKSTYSSYEKADEQFVKMIWGDPKRVDWINREISDKELENNDIYDVVSYLTLNKTPDEFFDKLMDCVFELSQLFNE